MGNRKTQTGLPSKRCRSTCGSYTKFYTCGKIGRKYLLLITAMTDYNDFSFLSVDSKLEFSGKKYVHNCMELITDPNRLDPDQHALDANPDPAKWCEYARSGSTKLPKTKLIWIWYRYLTYLIELLGDGVPDLCFGHVRGHVPIPHKVQVLATIPVDYDLFQDLPAAFRETTSLLLLRCHSCFWCY